MKWTNFVDMFFTPFRNYLAIKYTTCIIFLCIYFLLNFESNYVFGSQLVIIPISNDHIISIKGTHQQPACRRFCRPCERTVRLLILRSGTDH